MMETMDYAVVTENQFSPVSDTQNELMGDDGFTMVRNKRKCTRPSPCEKQKFQNKTTDEKLNLIFDELQSIRTSDLQSIRDSQHVTEKGMKLLQEMHDNVIVNVRHVYSAVNKSIDMLKLLSYKSIDLEARSRRNNLVFRNMPYMRGDNCFNLARDFLTQELDIDGNDVYIERAHLFGPFNNRFPTRRDIIVCFRDYHDTNRIMNAVGNLRNTPYFVDRDYPKEIVDARRRLWGRYKEARTAGRESGHVVKMQFPAKIVVNGRVTHDEFPQWNEVMKGTRDRSFRHVHYDDIHTGENQPTMNVNERIPNSPYVAPRQTHSFVQRDATYSSIVNRNGAPSDPQQTVYSNGHTSSTPILPPRASLGPHIRPHSTARTSRDTTPVNQQLSTVNIDHPVNLITDGAQCRTGHTVTGYSTGSSTAHAPNASTSGQSPIAASNTQINMPSISQVQQQSIFRSSSPVNVPKSSSNANNLQPPISPSDHQLPGPSRVTDQRDTSGSRVSPRQSRSATRRQNNSKSPPRDRRTDSVSRNRVQRSDSVKRKINSPIDSSTDPSAPT